MAGIIDQWGNPVSTVALKKEQAAPTMMGVRRPNNDHQASGLTPAKLARMLKSSVNGDPEAYLALAEDMEERDLHYAGVLMSRKLQVAGLEITAEAASESAEDVANADMVRALIKRDAFETELVDILDAIGKGFSATEIIWDTSESQWEPVALKWRDPRWFRFADEDGETPLLRDVKGDVPLSPFKWVFHQAKVKSGLSIRGGIARAVCWTFLFKSFTQKDWAIFCEAYGQPLRLGKWGEGASEVDKEVLLQAVANIGVDYSAIVPASMSVEFVKADISGSHELYLKRCDWLDQQVSKVVLGQTGTTDAIAGGYTIERFTKALEADRSHLAQRLDQTNLRLKAIRQADSIAALKRLQNLRVPRLPDTLTATLSSKVDSIEASSRARLRDHFKRFHLGREGEQWVKYGLDHLQDEACPFCGRKEADELGMVTLYSKIFSELYKEHYSKIVNAADIIEAELGASGRSTLRQSINLNADALTKLKEFYRIAETLPEIETIMQSVSSCYEKFSVLFDQKRQSPLEPIEAHAIAVVEDELDRARNALSDYNRAVEKINDFVGLQMSAPKLTEAQANRELDELLKLTAGEDLGVQARLQNYFRWDRGERRAKNARTVAQTRLKAANEDAAKQYPELVNLHLKRFGATFKISEISNSMPGNAGSSEYGLVLRGHTIGRGRGREVGDLPDFRSALSAGDKTTLAFAFFLASLERDKRLGEKVVVFDDPMSSHDSFRKSKTVEALCSLSRRSSQIIVLSHDEYFIRDLCRAAHHDTPSVAYQIEYNDGEQWSQASLVDPDDLCMTDHAKSLGALKAFATKRAGNPDDVVIKVRKVLETHYRRSFSGYFSPSQNLGKIWKSIQLDGPTHPCFEDLERIRSCDLATCEHHHGDDAQQLPKTSVDPDELRVIVTDALELVGAVRKAQSK